MKNSVHADVLFLGLEGSYERLSAAHSPEQAFAATFEALNWITSIDDRFGMVTGDKAMWIDNASGTANSAGGITLGALRYVRNAVHHQWAEALELKKGAQFPINLGAGQLFGEWVWVPITPPRNPTGEADYNGNLLGQSSRLTVHNAASLFAIHAGLIGASTPKWLVPNR